MYELKAIKLKKKSRVSKYKQKALWILEKNDNVKKTFSIRINILSAFYVTFKGV